QGVHVTEWHLVKTGISGQEAFAVNRVGAGRDWRQGAAMEGLAEGDDAYALAITARVMVASHDLEAGFHSLGAGVAEEDAVGEGQVHQPAGQLLGLRNAKQVGAVPDTGGLLLQCR